MASGSFHWTKTRRFLNSPACSYLPLLTFHQVRFHGNASGLPLLGRNDRTDDRNEGGIWYAMQYILGSFVHS